jgi:hypothetical protein
VSVRAHENPFRAERIEALRFRFLGEDMSALAARFARLGHRGVLVGPHGSGKTTLREELERVLAAEGWRVRALVLDGGGRASWKRLAPLVDDAGARDLVSIDGLDCVPPLVWLRLRRATRGIGGLLATSHRKGRLPTLCEHRTSLALLEDLVCELVGETRAAALAPRCEALFAQHGGDVRACLRALYDEAAGG